MGQYSETLGETGGMYLTDAELEALTANNSGSSGDAAYSVGLRDTYPPWFSDPGGTLFPPSW